MTSITLRQAILETISINRVDEASDRLSGIGLSDVRRLAASYGCSIRDVEIEALAAGITPERYRRNCGTIGIKGQRALLTSSVTVVGAGGLGGFIIEGLARMGVGRLTIIDCDRFSENNLNRQLGCTEITIGQPKATVLAERVKSVNSAIEATAIVTLLGQENASGLLSGALVVVDALDSLPTRLLLQRTTQALRIPLIHGAIAGYTGQVMVIYPGDAGLLGLYGDRPGLERGVEVVLGNPAATPMMIAAWQVGYVVQLLTGVKVQTRRLMLFDMEFGDCTKVQI